MSPFIQLQERWPSILNHMKNINPFKLGLCIVVKKKSLDKILKTFGHGKLKLEHGNQN